jgi:hypothetical protein
MKDLPGLADEHRQVMELVHGVKGDVDLDAMRGHVNRAAHKLITSLQKQLDRAQLACLADTPVRAGQQKRRSNVLQKGLEAWERMKGMARPGEHPAAATLKAAAAEAGCTQVPDKGASAQLWLQWAGEAAAAPLNGNINLLRRCSDTNMWVKDIHVARPSDSDAVKGASGMFSHKDVAEAADGMAIGTDDGWVASTKEVHSHLIRWIEDESRDRVYGPTRNGGTSSLTYVLFDVTSNWQHVRKARLKPLEAVKESGKKLLEVAATLTTVWDAASAAGDLTPLESLADKVGLPRPPNPPTMDWHDKCKMDCDILPALMSETNLELLHAAMDPENKKWKDRVMPKHRRAWARMAAGMKDTDELRKMLESSGMAKGKNARWLHR